MAKGEKGHHNLLAKIRKNSEGNKRKKEKKKHLRSSGQIQVRPRDFANKNGDRREKTLHTKKSVTKKGTQYGWGFRFLLKPACTYICTQKKKRKKARKKEKERNPGKL
jgi:hypothetical protein